MLTNNNNLTIYKANKIVEAGFKLSLNEQRVILACIAQVRSTDSLLTCDEFELTASHFSQMFHVTESRAYHALTEVSETLFNRYVVVDNPYPDKPRIKRLKMRWISAIKHVPDEGKIILNFSQDMLPYLSELKGRFTRYELKNIGKMTCVYAIRLYELLIQWQKRGSRTVDIEWLKRQFEIELLYSDVCDLKKRVLIPAVEDINENSNLHVSWQQIKTGRKITHFTFKFREKVSDTPKKTNSPKSKILETVNNIDYFYDMRQKFGDLLPTNVIPEEIVNELKKQGRW
jgi:plasmid replication initiation protein